MNKSIVFFNIIVFIFFVSCDNKCCDTIITSLNNQCLSDKEVCQVSFKETFDLQWDTLYIFDSMLYPEEISDEIGIRYGGEVVTDGEKLFLFVNNGHILKKLNEPCSNVTFVDMKKNGVVRIRSQNFYKMKRKTLNGKKHYLLFSN